MFVECHIEIADEVVAFLAGFLGSDPFAPFLPCEHRLADMDTAVVDDVGLHHLVPVGFKDAGERVTQKIVADVAEVEGLVGVGRRIFHHHKIRFGSLLADSPILIRRNVMEQTKPIGGADAEVKETFHHIEFLYSLYIFREPFADFSGCGLWILMRSFKEWENHYCEVALKFFLSG